eukprot:GHVT01062030.1.p1 GENE.GHVT01062030.1~~GHVT01062030.1.p1  ORF type:complete len:359 (+),score=41.02 GHVT01062030.1:191-1267(+)
MAVGLSATAMLTGLVGCSVAVGLMLSQPKSAPPPSAPIGSTPPPPSAPIESTPAPLSSPIGSTLPAPSAPVPSPLPIGSSRPPSPPLSPYPTLSPHDPADDSSRARAYLLPSPLPAVKPSPRYIVEKAPIMKPLDPIILRIADPDSSPEFAALNGAIRSYNWLERDPEAINLVDHPRFTLSSDRIDSEMLQEQVKGKKKIAYFFVDLMGRSDYDENTDTFIPRSKDLDDADKDTLRGVLSPYHIRNPSIAAEKYVGPKAIPIPLLPKDAPNPLAELDTIKKILNRQLPTIANLLDEGYKFVVVGQQEKHKTTQKGFPLHHGLGVSHAVEHEEWFKLMHQFLFEVSYKSGITSYYNDGF